MYVWGGAFCTGVDESLDDGREVVEAQHHRRTLGQASHTHTLAHTRTQRERQEEGQKKEALVSLRRIGEPRRDFSSCAMFEYIVYIVHIYTN
jgi:hypothetical protein